MKKDIEWLSKGVRKNETNWTDFLAVKESEIGELVEVAE